MNHQIFERKWRSCLRVRPCLFEYRLSLNRFLVKRRVRFVVALFLFGQRPFKRVSYSPSRTLAFPPLQGGGGKKVLVKMWWWFFLFTYPTTSLGLWRFNNQNRNNKVERVKSELLIELLSLALLGSKLSGWTSDVTWYVMSATDLVQLTNPTDLKWGKRTRWI